MQASPETLLIVYFVTLMRNKNLKNCITSYLTICSTYVFMNQYFSMSPSLSSLVYGEQVFLNAAKNGTIFSRN